MSWDVLLFNITSDVTSLEQLGTQDPPELGPKSGVISMLREVFPDISFSDPNWAVVSRSSFSIEFNFGEDPLQHLMLHVRGSDDAICAIRTICEVSNWRAFDMTTGDFINFNNDPARGLRKWRSFRDKVVAQMRSQQKVSVNQADYSAIIKKKKRWWQFWK